MSRKTVSYVVAMLATLLTFFQEQFGLSLDPGAITAGIGAILTYILFEAKLDLKAMASQPDKWKDPKFWITFVSVVLSAVEAQFKIGIPVEAIVSVLTVVVGFLFGRKLISTSRPY